VFRADEALARGFVSEVLPTKEDCLKRAIEMATLIASKSPVAVSTTKRSIVFSRDHSVSEGLEHIGLLNSVML
jgi:delta(3,5)-delta(2,4)-dienoyl-CoA isomerase